MKQKSVKNKNVIVHNDRGDSVRLNKYISESGLCSRRQADKLIEETQRVSIEKRFADNLHKCKSPEALKSHERQLKQALTLQDMIQSICHTTL